MEEYKYSKQIVETTLEEYIDTIIKTHNRNTESDDKKLNIMENSKSNYVNNNFREMIKYALSGGKRIRPIIALEMTKLFSKNHNINPNNSTSKEVIIFLENLHSASLILDDLPCMDNDDYRRGQLTFHKKYGLNTTYLVANFMIGKSLKNIVNFISKNKETSNNIRSLFTKEIFNNNFLTSLGQIKDLDSNDDRESKFLDKIENRLLKNQYFNSFLTKVNSINNLTQKNIKSLIWLNMKTFPLFYLSFLLPYLLNNTTNDSNNTTNDSNNTTNDSNNTTNDSNKINQDTVNKIEYLSLCFSIMFQICDDLDDIEKDYSIKKINSHLKILDKSSIINVYRICEKDFKETLGNVCKAFSSIPNVIEYFVEILNKKIEIYVNGRDKK